MQTTIDLVVRAKNQCYIGHQIFLLYIAIALLIQLRYIHSYLNVKWLYQH